LCFVQDREIVQREPHIRMALTKQFLFDRESLQIATLRLIKLALGKIKCGQIVQVHRDVITLGSTYSLEIGQNPEVKLLGLLVFALSLEQGRKGSYVGQCCRVVWPEQSFADLDRATSKRLAMYISLAGVIKTAQVVIYIGQQ